MKNSRKKDLHKKEKMMILAEFLAIDGLAAFIFYRSIIPFLIFLPFVFFYGKYRKRIISDKKRKELAYQFRESILSVSNALNAGYSVENAFLEAYSDMNDMFGRDAYITEEYRTIAKRLKNNEAIEIIIRDLAKRSGIEDINDFADVFAASKRTGGDMTKIIKRAASNISDKMDVKREIDTILSSRKYEQRIMEIIPFAIIGYLGVTSPGFIDVLYHNVTGAVIMTVCLDIYLTGFIFAEKIMRIEV